MKTQRKRRFQDIEQVNKIKSRLNNSEYVSQRARDEMECYDLDPVNYQFDLTNSLVCIGTNKMDDKLKPVSQNQKQQCLAAVFCQMAHTNITICNVVDRCPVKNCKFKNGQNPNHHTSKIQFDSSYKDTPKSMGKGLLKIIEQRVNTQQQ